MTKEQLARWRELGFEFPEFYDSVAKEEVVEVKILNISFSKVEQDNAAFQKFLVKILLSSDPYNSKITAQIDDRQFTAYKKLDTIENINVVFADVFVDLSIPRNDEVFSLIVDVVDNFTKKTTDTKTVNVKVDNQGGVGETEEKTPNFNMPKSDDCDVNFKKIAPIILRHEGGFVDDPDDKGGKTNKGITWNTWLAYAKSDLNLDPTLVNLKKLTDDQATLIYKKRYWEPKGFCIIKNLKIALMFYDWTITSGGARREFAKLLENEYDQNIIQDKNFGANISMAINNVDDQDNLLIELTQLRKDYYTSLSYKMNKDGSFKKDDKGELIKTSNHKFLKGWIKRVDDCLKVKL